MISRSDTSAKLVALVLICLFPCGAYFIYDAPASLQNYFMAGLKITNTEYMAYYSWYSAPCIVFSILGGLLVDKYLGHRFGAVCFCGLVMLGQFMFAYGVSNSGDNENVTYIAKMGRSIAGAGVESIAVASNVYLDRWFKGSDLQALAFGSALAVWRVSSSVNLMAMTPFYKKTNVMDPVDGSTNNFKTCKSCSDWETGENKYQDVSVLLPDLKYDHSELYYCYNKKVIDGCQISDLAGIDGWHENKKAEICKLQDNSEIQQFFEKSKILEEKCLVISDDDDNSVWQWNNENCECLDKNYVPKDEDLWAWIDTKLIIYGSYPEVKSFLGNSKSEAAILKELEPLRTPFYWGSTFGEYLSDPWDLKKRDELVGILKSIDCRENQQINLSYEDKFEDAAPSSWANVGEFVKAMQDTGLYSSSCNFTTGEAYLVPIPEKDTELRLESLGYCYYSMLVVTFFALIMGGILMVIDQKAEENDNKGKVEDEEENGKEESQSISEILSEQIAVAKQLPLETWMIYLVCILFYTSVFLFVAGGQKFLIEYSDVSEDIAGVALSVVYLAAVPFNFFVGFLIKKFRNHLLFLTAGFFLAGGAHFMLLTFKGFVPAVLGSIILAFSYSCVGTTIWPLACVIVPEDITGRMLGVMYAMQQLGFTVASYIIGFITTNFGYLTLELFFIAICGAGAFLMFILLGRIGKNMPSVPIGHQPVQDDADSSEEEKFVK